MKPETLFYIIIVFIVVEFVIEKVLSYLNVTYFKEKIPEELQDVFDEKEYQKSKAYQLENYRFGLVTSSISFILILLLLFFDVFAILDQFVKNLTDNNLLQSLFFFGILLLVSTLFSIPFSYYDTFVIEEKYGFNRSAKKLFFIDQLKSLLLTIVLGGFVITALVWFYQLFGKNFWVYAWLVIAAFIIFINMFYTSLIVPLFNKLKVLDEGDLRQKLESLAQKTNYDLQQIFVIDGSKRSNKANAYFTGFGSKKKVVLYDTLINDLTPDEISAVLAHEIGHYKHKHIIINMILSLLSIGIFLYFLSWLIDSKLLAKVLGVNEPSFHIGLLAFALLFTPVSFLIGLLTNYISRKFEYQADNFAKKYTNSKFLISALKKLTKNNLSNLIPHPWYVFVHYSHPTLLQRIKNLKK